MTYLIKKSDGTILVNIDDDVVNTTSSSLTLFGQNLKNYGQYVDQNFVGLLNNFSNSTAPATPLVGQIWYDKDNQLVKLFDGFLWRVVSPQFDGTSGILKITVNFWNSPVTVIATVVEQQILSVDSSYAISNEFLQDIVEFENTQLAFKSLFPNGLIVGTTLAVLSNVTLELHGKSYSTSLLTNPKMIGLSGDFNGNVIFDGSSNVNIVASFSNLYIGNSNVSINGMYSNVTVDSTGRIVSLGNISYNDVVSALGYRPFSNENVSIDSTSDTLVFRDQFGSFSANLVTATTTYTKKFASNVTIGLSGDVEGYSLDFDGSSNVIIDSVRAQSGNLIEGVYNTVTVNTKGTVESGQLIEQFPVGSIILYNNSVVTPEGWAVCNGSNIVTPSGQTVTTPNLVNAAVGGTTYIMKVFKNVYLPSNDTIVGSLSINLVGGGVPTVTFVGGPDIKYPPLVFANVNVASTTTNVSTYTKVKTARIPAGFNGSNDTPNSSWYNGRNYKVNDTLYFDFPNFGSRAVAKVTEITSNGGISRVQIEQEGRYDPFVKNALGVKADSLKSVKPKGGSGQDAEFDLEIERINQPIFVQDVDFKDNLFFDAVSMILSGGDPNAVMLSQADIFGDLSNLTIIQILDNLTTRRLTGLPPRVGKYMLTIEDIINYSGVLQVPVNLTSFTIALQNRLMLLKVTDFANEFSYLGIYPSDDKIFGACYLGFQQFVAVMKGVKTETVGKTLTDAGLSLTNINTIDNITNDLMLSYCSKMIVNAKVAIYNNRIARQTAIEINSLTKTNIVPVPNPLIVTPLLTTGNANIVISESLIDGIPVVFGGTKPTSNANVAFGGGSFILGGSSLNSSVYSTLNGVRYGYYSSDNDNNSGGGGPVLSSTQAGLSTGTGSRIPTGSITVVAGAPSGGSVASPSISPSSGYYGALFGQESGSNYNVFNGTTGAPYGDLSTKTISEVYALQDYHRATTGNSTAVGVGQMIKGTLQEIVNSPEARALGITSDTLFTPEVQNQLLEVFATRNSNTLSSKGIPVNDATLAGSHLLGTGGFSTLYNADPNTPVSQLFSQTVIDGNPGILKGKTVAQVIDYFERRYGVGQTWRNGVVFSETVVTPTITTTTLPPPAGGSISSSSSKSTVTPSDLAKGMTAAASALASALSPPSAITQVVSAIVPQTVKDVVSVATTVVQNAATIAQKAGASIVENATNILNTALENAGENPPAAKPPSSVGGTVVNTVRPVVPTATRGISSGSSGSSGGGGGGADSGQAANRSSSSSSSSGTISGVSANNNGSISVTAAPSTRNPTSSSTYGISNTTTKPSSGGTGTTSKPSPPAAGSGCFVYETEIEMADGTSKQIGTVRLGDQTRGGEVLAIHCYDGAPLYNYRGVHVSGTHYVIENGEPIMVQDSVYAEKIDNVYGLYTIDTTERRIFVNGIEFADHNGDGVIFDFFKNSTATTFNSEKEIFDEVIRQVKDAKL